MSETFGVIPPHPHEVGRVMVTSQRHRLGPHKPAALRVAIADGKVMLGIGMETAFLDATQRDEFMRLWVQAERQVEAGDD